MITLWGHTRQGKERKRRKKREKEEREREGKKKFVLALVLAEKNHRDDLRVF